MRRLRQQRSGRLATITLVALLIQSLAAFGQRASPPPAAAAAPAQGAGPSFQSGGLKATVTSISAQNTNVSLSLLIENKTQENLLVAVIGPPVGTNGGNVFDAVAIGGIAYCIYNPQNIARHQLDRSFEINSCL